MKTRDKHETLAHLRQVATFLDSRFSLAGYRFGVDGIIGLVPGVGDAIGGLIALYIVLRAHLMGAPSHVTNRMLIGVMIDVLLGSIPVAGDIFDFFYKVNNRNLRMIEEWIARSEG